jgi:FAD-dependent sensor of blue light
MNLFSITYVSARVGDFLVNRIVDLAERAAAYNSVSEVTGFLCHVDGRFLQTIEGDYGEVNRIYHTRIVPARSHMDLRLIQLETHPERRFPNWTMGFANIAPTDRALLLQYFPDGIDSPEPMKGPAAAGFLRALGESSETFTLR